MPTDTAAAIDSEVIIVGAGPAGLSAAIILARACRTVLIFDSGKPRNAATRHLHGFLTRDQIPPQELVAIARDDLKKYDTVRIEEATVAGARCDSYGFEVTLSDGRKYHSRKLLIATGVVDNMPDLPGLKNMFGCTVFHCPFCDAWEFRQQTIATYGKGEKGFGLSLEMLGWSKSIVLCTDGPTELDDEQSATLARNGITVRDEPVQLLEGSDGILERVVFKSGEPLQCRALFFTTGQHQASPLASALGCEFNEKGTVRTGRHESTTVPGLYVAGDASRDVQWVVVAAAEGAEAAYAITQDLIKESWRR